MDRRIRFVFGIRQYVGIIRCTNLFGIRRQDSEQIQTEAVQVFRRSSMNCSNIGH